MTSADRLSIARKALYATESIARGYATSAIELMTEVLRIDPDVASHYALRASAYILQERFELALGDAEMAIKKDSHCVDAVALRIDALLHMGELERAKAAVRDADGCAETRYAPAVLRVSMLVQFFCGEYNDAAATARRLLETAASVDTLCAAARVLSAALEALSEVPAESTAGRALGLKTTTLTLSDFTSKHVSDDSVDQASETRQEVDRLMSTAQAAFAAGNIGAAAHEWESALTFAQIIGDAALCRAIAVKLAAAHRKSGRPELSAAVLSNDADPLERAKGLASAAVSSGNVGAAVAHLQEARGIESAKGNDAGAAKVENSLGWLHLSSGALSLASEMFAAALERSRAVSFAAGTVTALNGLAGVALREKKLEVALQHASVALEQLPALHAELAADHGNSASSNHALFRTLHAQTYRGLVEVYVAADRSEDALEWAERMKQFSFFDAANEQWREEGTNDVTADEIKVAVATVAHSLISFTMLSRTSCLACAVLPSGVVQHKMLTLSRAALEFDPLALVDYVRTEAPEEANPHSTCKWRTTEELPSVADGRVLRPSLELLAVLYETLLAPFADVLASTTALTIIPHGFLMEVPWSELLPSRDALDVCVGDSVGVALSTSAASFVRSVTTSFPRAPSRAATLGVCMVQDVSIVGAAEVRGAVSALPGVTVFPLDGSTLGVGALTQMPVVAPNADVAHITARCSRMPVAFTSEVQTEMVFGMPLASAANPRFAGAIAKHSICDAAHKIRSGSGWVYFDRALPPFSPLSRLGVVRAGSSVPVDEFGAQQQLRAGCVVVLDLAGAADDLYVESWSAPLVRGCLTAGARAVIVVRFLANEPQERVAVLTLLYETLATAPTEGVTDLIAAVAAAERAVRTKVATSRGSITTRGSLALFF